jgi:hypothetical protein
MEKIIKTIPIKHNKSSFLFDVIQSKGKKKFIKITQTIENEDTNYQLKINPTILPQIISILQQLEKDIVETTIAKSHFLFPIEKQKSVIKSYFKNVTIKELAIQFNCTEKIIEQILHNNEIEIVDNKLPKLRRKFGFRKRKP